jgi:DNA-binding MarR family transcriptional regulator
VKKVYLRYLALTQALDSPLAESGMDETQRRLLELIAVRHADGKSLTVSEAMAAAFLASPATIHRKLDDLREFGMIAPTFEGKNRRTKYLVPTQTADAYFHKLGQLIQQALKEP